MIYIENATLYTASGKINHAALCIDNQTITAVGRESDVACPPNAQRFDAQGQNLVPGFIDLQVNGALGMDITTNPESIWKVGEYLPAFGTTSFLPTIVSSPPATVQKAQTILSKGPPPGYRGAKVLGLHLEGPYLNPRKCGAHDLSHIRLPKGQEYQDWTAEKHVRLVTLAPELPGALEAIMSLVKHGVSVAAGHSMASYEEAQAGIKAGIRSGTHLFNAMPAQDHRQPGLVSALLLDERLTCSLIADGQHLHPATVQLAWKTLGPGRTCLVSDAMAGLGMPTGDYQLGNHIVHHDGETARLPDGTLAGSLLYLQQALRNLIRFTGCTLDEAILAVTRVPAGVLYPQRTQYGLAVGASADLVLLDHDLQVKLVWIDGRQVDLSRDAS
ncbi:MAG: N-acetylglucosamine-6-phosphate deacetylase [Anaerolineales bacterium]|nr:N-acetylglucosamine-6-phosphate deacetylase [Anaerolineae bacterium]PWB51550.1 MAG: N-acetylglucosamine-6-phosphate deacetylase [Anaerolineales bacterium]